MAVNDIIYTYPKGITINRKDAKTRADDATKALRQMGYVTHISQNRNEYRVVATPPKRR
jgi:hypothetical protein